MDLATAVLSPVTRDDASTTVLGPWSRDSLRIAINSQQRGVREFSVASGQLRGLTGEPVHAYDWSPDGSFLLAGDLSGRHLYKLALSEGAKIEEIAAPSDRRVSYRFAPDGKTVAYTSNRSDRPEVMVVAFPSFSEQRQISVDGGEYPVWSNDGRELFFETPDGTIMSAEIRTQPKLESGVPRPLFKTRPLPGVGYTYWPAPDGKRFLVMESLEYAESPNQAVVLNWQAELAAK